MALTIVTGGGRGIGAATVLRLARAGHDVVVNYRRDAETAARVAAEATGLGVRAVAVPADVADPAEAAPPVAPKRRTRARATSTS